MGLLATHPRSTIGDLARAVNLDPEHVADCLTQLTRSGEIYKVSHGDTTQQPARPAGSAMLGRLAVQYRVEVD